jgi:hypothetical protein
MAVSPCSVTPRKVCGCAVLEADRHRQARGQLAMNLALGGARADRAPRDQVGGELRRDRVEELAAGRQPELVQIEEEPARPAQALVDGEASVEVRIIDQTLPADRGPRLLEVHAHDDAEVGGQLPRQLAQAPAVVEASFRVMDRAGSDDDK